VIKPNAHKERRLMVAYLCLALAMAIVGAYVGFSKLLVAVFPVFLLAWLRFGIAAVAMAHWLKREPDCAPLDAASKRFLFLESFFGNFLFSVCMLFGMRYATALTAGVVMAMIPATVAFLSWLLLKEKIAPRTWLAIALAVGGVVLLTLGRNAEANAEHALLGIALLVGAMLCESIYVVIGKKLTGNISPRRISALINLWGFLLVTPLGLWQAMSFDFSSVTLPIWGGLAVYALAASVWTVWLWMTGLKTVPASRAGVFTIFLPIAAAIVGIVFLSETLTMLHAVAFVLAIAAVLLATLEPRNKL
jgi:drug/metabolite transporter (DMT)-like permease